MPVPTWAPCHLCYAPKPTELASLTFHSEAEAAKKLSSETHEVAQRKVSLQWVHVQARCSNYYYIRLHDLSHVQVEQMDKLARALGIEGQQSEGDAFNRELQVR